jgi:hypothetical protein
MLFQNITPFFSTGMEEVAVQTVDLRAIVVDFVSAPAKL